MLGAAKLIGSWSLDTYLDMDTELIAPPLAFINDTDVTSLKTITEETSIEGQESLYVACDPKPLDEAPPYLEFVATSCQVLLLLFMIDSTPFLTWAAQLTSFMMQNSSRLITWTLLSLLAL